MVTEVLKEKSVAHKSNRYLLHEFLPLHLSTPLLLDGVCSSLQSLPLATIVAVQDYRHLCYPCLLILYGKHMLNYSQT